MNRTSLAGRALALALVTAPALAAPPGVKPDDFPPSQATPGFTVKVGEKVTVGGPRSMNFLPNEFMDVYVVPHRVWREGDALAANAVKRGRVRSDKDGRLVATEIWVASKAGTFDIIVDYDGNGRFSYSLDSLDAFVVREK